MVTETDTESAAAPNYQVRALSRGLDILETFSEETTELRVSDLSELLDIPKPTLVRLLSVLTSRGYLSRGADSERYRLGVCNLERGAAYLAGNPLPDLAKPTMYELTQVCGLTSNIGILDEFEVVHVQVMAPQRPVRFWAEVGKREEAHVSALGKALLAYLGDDDLASYLAQERIRRTPTTIVDAEDMRLELQTIRAAGYAVDNEESNPDIGCLAAPIRNWTGDVVAAISVSGLKWEVIDGPALSRNAELVVDAANRISADLGWSTSIDAD